jgi:hypothetical protein
MNKNYERPARHGILRGARKVVTEDTLTGQQKRAGPGE